MAIWQYTYIMSHHVGLKGQSWKEVRESFHVESSSFIQKIKVFNIFNARQLVSVYCSHVESLGNFKNKYKTKKEKVRSQTTYITKFSKRKREGDRQRRRRKKGKKKKKQLPHGATPTSSLSSSFSPSSLFYFLTNETFRVSARYLFIGRHSQILPTQPIRGWYDRYFFRYKIRGLSVPVHWSVRYIPVVPAGTVQNWLPWFEVFHQR